MNLYDIYYNQNNFEFKSIKNHNENNIKQYEIENKLSNEELIELNNKETNIDKMELHIEERENYFINNNIDHKNIIYNCKINNENNNNNDKDNKNNIEYNKLKENKENNIFIKEDFILKNDINTDLNLLKNPEKLIKSDKDINYKNNNYNDIINNHNINENFSQSKTLKMKNQDFNAYSLGQYFNNQNNFNSNFTNIGLFSLKNQKNNNNKIIYMILHRKIVIDENNTIDNFFFQDLTELINHRIYEIEETNKKQKVFAKISHEFKTPLNSIIGNINI
jgi:hypothetical protein